jgi:hypothetical protein
MGDDDRSEMGDDDWDGIEDDGRGEKFFVRTVSEVDGDATIHKMPWTWLGIMPNAPNSMWGKMVWNFQPKSFRYNTANRFFAGNGR